MGEEERGGLVESTGSEADWHGRKVWKILPVICG